MTFKEKLIKNNVNVVVLIHELPLLLSSITNFPTEIINSYPNLLSKFVEGFNKEVNKYDHIGNNIIIYTDGMIFVNCIIYKPSRTHTEELCLYKADKFFRDTHKFLIPNINNYYYRGRPTISYDEI